MPSPDRIANDVHFVGATTFLGSVAMPDGSITSDMISSNLIDATKLRRRLSHKYFQDGTIADSKETIHIVYGNTGTLIGFQVAVTEVVTTSNSIVDVDLLVNGSSVLSAVVQITNSHSVYEVVLGTITTTALVQGDVIEIDIDATVYSGTLPVGLVVITTQDEDPA